MAAKKAVVRPQFNRYVQSFRPASNDVEHALLARLGNDDLRYPVSFAITRDLTREILRVRRIIHRHIGDRIARFPQLCRKMPLT